MVGPVRILCWIALSSAGVTTVDRPNSSVQSKAKVEFRWLEDSRIKDLTEDKGIRTTCGEELSYPHRKPVLTNADVASARLHNNGSVMGLPGDHFMIAFHLSDNAIKKLVSGSGEESVKILAVFVDGKYWGATPFRKARTSGFIPHAGFIKSQAVAERIVAACKKG